MLLAQAYILPHLEGDNSRSAVGPTAPRQWAEAPTTGVPLGARVRGISDRSLSRSGVYTISSVCFFAPNHRCIPCRSYTHGSVSSWGPDCRSHDRGQTNHRSLSLHGITLQRPQGVRYPGAPNTVNRAAAYSR